MLKRPKGINILLFGLQEKGLSFCKTKYDTPEKNFHKNHTIKNILKQITTQHQINILKGKILKKYIAFDSLTKSLDEWVQELIKKIEGIKKKLNNEIRLLEKLFFNFNINYIDYSYYSNFHSFLDVIEDTNNKYLKLFMESHSFERKTKCIFDLLQFKEPEMINQKLKLKSYFLIGDDNILVNFTDEFLLCTNYEKNSFELLSYSKNKDTFLITTKIDFKEKISSITYSNGKTKIYLCLENEKAIVIINFNPLNNTLELSDDKIEGDSYDSFKKCIPIDNNRLIAIDNYMPNK